MICLLHAPSRQHSLRGFFIILKKYISTTKFQLRIIFKIEDYDLKSETQRLAAWDSQFLQKIAKDIHKRRYVISPIYLTKRTGRARIVFEYDFVTKPFPPIL